MAASTEEEAAQAPLQHPTSSTIQPGQTYVFQQTSQHVYSTVCREGETVQVVKTEGGWPPVQVKFSTGCCAWVNYVDLTMPNLKGAERAWAIMKLPISEFVGTAGPPLVPKSVVDNGSQTLDGRMREAAREIQATKENRRKEEKAVAEAGTPWAVSSELEALRLKAPPALVSAMASAQHSSCPNPRKVSGIYEDPEYLEMCQLLDQYRAGMEDLPHWKNNLFHSLQGLLTQVQITRDQEMAMKQLKGVYAWFSSHKGALGLLGNNVGDGGRGNAAEAAEAKGAAVRGGYFSTASPCEWIGTNADEDPNHDATGKYSAIVQTAAIVDASLTGNSTQLPNARERLKSFQTHSLCGPQISRKLKAAVAAEGGSSRLVTPEPGVERSTTPSTATGGALTARSLASARSTPTAGRCSPSYPSRPSSAAFHQRPGTAGTVRPTMSGLAAAVAGAATSGTPTSQRPETAGERQNTIPWLHLPPPVTSCQAAYGGPAASYKGSNAYVQQSTREMCAAELAMEARWRERRNREVTAQIRAEEEREVVEAWSRRRARVEEEITRNAEVGRFQSETAQRRYVVPSDAAEDISATEIRLAGDAADTREEREVVMPMPSDGFDEAEAALHKGTRRSTRPVTPVLKTALRAFRQTGSHLGNTVDRMASVTKTDVAPTVTFPETPKQRLPLVNERVAHIRKLHARLLEPADNGGDDAVSDISSVREDAEWGDDPQEDQGEMSDDDQEEDEDDDEEDEKEEEYAEASAPPSPRSRPTSSKKSQPENISGGFVSLSAYTAGPQGEVLPTLRMEDEADVLATACDYWRSRHNGTAQDHPVMQLGSGAFDEIRERQLQEVEDIKRAFLKANLPINTALLKRADTEEEKEGYAEEVGGKEVGGKEGKGASSQRCEKVRVIASRVPTFVSAH
eukprot:TRINITY_DN8035_c0_g1_i2.p1 TRINITY_DN8035_c0_g1~~TRINITY_DN8035_c0_g1_i2.p1  ORF type:complete len:929 (-),score=192.69 TRINITY_DN8035_c0_g1_i2:223-2955(-)